MTGLLLKDYYSLRGYLFRQIALLSLLYVVIAVVLKSVALLTPMMIMGITMTLMISFSVDEASKWDGYAHTLPVSVNMLVGEKYILFYGVLIGGAAVVGALCCLLDVLFFHEGVLPILLSTGACVLLYLFVSALLLPVFFKYGVEKGRMLTTLVFLIPFFIMVWGGPFLMQTGGDLASLPWMAIITAVVATVAVFCAISFFISIKLYKNKEF
ncbi:MAG: ABC-2 transporter permease [Oscillospiraceae bacterium]|nr:ABC-2 transporter permease [Oscillospiraceae bacterium]